jgi:hypothetical protein
MSPRQAVHNGSDLVENVVAAEHNGSGTDSGVAVVLHQEVEFFHGERAADGRFPTGRGAVISRVSEHG